MGSELIQKQRFNRETLIDPHSEEHLMLRLWAWIFSLCVDVADCTCLRPWYGPMVLTVLPCTRM